MNNFAEVLESYLIPTTEGLRSWFTAKTQNRAKVKEKLAEIKNMEPMAVAKLLVPYLTHMGKGPAADNAIQSLYQEYVRSPGVINRTTTEKVNFGGCPCLVVTDKHGKFAQFAYFYMNPDRKLQDVDIITMNTAARILAGELALESLLDDIENISDIAMEASAAEAKQSGYVKITPQHLIDALTPYIANSMSKTPYAVSELNILFTAYKNLVKKNRYANIVEKITINGCPAVLIVYTGNGEPLFDELMYITKENCLRSIELRQLINILNTKRLDGNYKEFSKKQ